MKQAILSISIDENHSVEVRFEGEIMFEIPMLWALELGKNWLTDKIKNDQNLSTAWTTKEEQSESIVTKSEAINIFLDARTKIENRLQAIAKSDDSQKFRIDSEIISKI